MLHSICDEPGGLLRYTVDVSGCWLGGPILAVDSMIITRRTVPRPPNYCAAPNEVVGDVAIAWSTALPPCRSCACLIPLQEISTFNPAHTYLIASTVEFAVRCMRQQGRDSFASLSASCPALNTLWDQRPDPDGCAPPSYRLCRIGYNTACWVFDRLLGIGRRHPK